MARRKSPASTEAEEREAAEASARAAADGTIVTSGEDDQDEGDDDDAITDAERDELLDRVLSDGVLARLEADTRRKISPEERRLLAEACYVFGIDPDPTLKPRELASYRYDAGDPNAATPIPAYVSLGTSGGLKIRYPMDEDTETRLRVVYNAFRVNKAGEREVLPLPADLTLPRSNVDGIVRSSEHQYRTGYLKEGGKAEAEKRQKKLEQLRRQGTIR
jgi:hypothetical protein